MENKTLKKRLKTATLILLTITMGLNGCKKDRSNQIAELQKSFTTKQEAKIYLNQKLNEYGKIIAKLSQNVAMKRLVNERVSLKFDGDYNVLLKDLVKPVTPEIFALKKGLNMSTAPSPATPDEPVQSVNLQELEQALTAPVLVNGDTLYPQIYIPFFEEQEEVGPIEPIEPGDPGTPIEPDPCLNATATITPIYPNPVIVPYDGEEIPGQETFTGYTYDQNGALIENIPVDECFAKRHRIWAITINERPSVPPSTIAETPTPNAQNIAQAAFIKKMRVKVNKESWIKGDNDLEMTWTMSWEDGLNPITNTYAIHPFELKFYSGFDPIYESTIALGKFSKKDVRKNRYLEINKDYAVFGNPTSFVRARGEWNSIRDWYQKMGTHIYYVIYEHDAWADKDVFIPIPFPKNGFPNTVKVIALTNNSPYISGVIKVVPVNYVSPQNNGLTTRTEDENDEIYFLANNRP